MSTKAHVAVTTWYVKGSGLQYEIWHSCGHISRGVFPYAKRSTSKVKVLEWLFGHETPFCRVEDCDGYSK